MKKLVSLLLVIPLFYCWGDSIHAEENNSIQEEMIYTIFVDRFNNGDQQLGNQVNVDDPEAYHGGDIKGITDKLDYIKQLGFTTISISSIMENAGEGYHGYWIENFFEVEEQFGTMEDLQKLVEEAHKRDLHVILEFVPNYVAPTHPFAKDADKTIPTSVKDSVWLDKAVTLNLENTEVKNMLFKAADFWLEEANIDGYNLHAIDQTPLPFLQEFVDHLRSVKPNIDLTGSVLHENDLTDEYDNVGIPLIENAGMQKAISDVLTNAGTPVEELYHTWESNGKRGGLVYVDDKFTKRFTQKIVESGQNPLTTWKIALVYLYTAPGVPQIYQGSEIPMDGASLEEVQRLVQFNNSDQDLQDYFNKIAAIRKQFPVLSYGDFELAGSSGAMSVFKRSDEDTTMFIAINNDTGTKAVSVTDVPDGMQLTGLLGDNIVRKNEQGKYKIGIDRESVEIFVVEKDNGFNWLFIGMIVGVFVLFILAVVLLSRKQRKNEAIQP
ncbi:alpha-amylase [Virgibacillus dakarensis]|uniref:Alpha-amylase n=1 Tax=Lentibacillus populi TaxID=1827502 RepID=A0A9W5TX60_9BACI|nr:MULTISPECIES: alpha-amylase family glycosyl hydrolase [Bacillaceae]MBT2215376.1 alpha-amylase [Virgibacillus dakarensis]MTW85453.1 alpha-amylase [Virgibacillus dakarensis]GGB39714.1 alpha-amylase [Lentibacillus populi]